MSENNNVSLNEMMDKTPRSKSTNTVDLTQGVVEPKKDENAKVEEKHVKVSATQTGHVNMSEMAPIDTESILPKREQKNEAEENLFADLDAAVERECESITKRVEALTEAQEEEAKKAAEEAENAEMATTDAEASNDNVNKILEDDEDFAAELGLADDEDADSNEVVNRVSINTDDTIEEAAAEKEVHAIDETVTPVVAKAETVVEKPSDVAVEKDEPIVARVVTNEKASILDGVNDEDLFADDDEVSEESASGEKSNEEMIEELKKEAKEKIVPIKKTLDLSKFTISKKSVNAQKAMKLAAQTRQSVADWALYNANRPISMTGLSGPEILKLNPENSSRNRLNTFRDMYRVMYDHVHDANKPEFETWLKQTRFVDMQHIYFALYMATFSGSNFINYSCPHCNKIFLKDIKFEDMIVYADDEARAKVRNILKMDTTSISNDEYPVDLYQISNSYVFGLRTPSIWNVIIETASLSDRFLEKHADLVDVVSYIDAIYIIDEENNNLIPVDTKPDPNDQAKTSARRIKAFYDIISQLSTEEYYTLRAHINSYDNDAGKVSYQFPACNCPDCATEIPANTEIGPDNMLFMRHQLAAIANM